MNALVLAFDMRFLPAVETMRQAHIENRARFFYSSGNRSPVSNRNLIPFLLELLRIDIARQNKPVTEINGGVYEPEKEPERVFPLFYFVHFVEKNRCPAIGAQIYRQQVRTRDSSLSRRKHKSRRFIHQRVEVGGKGGLTVFDGFGKRQPAEMRFSDIGCAKKQEPVFAAGQFAKNFLLFRVSRVRHEAFVSSARRLALGWNAGVEYAPDPLYLLADAFDRNRHIVKNGADPAHALALDAPAPAPVAVPANFGEIPARSPAGQAEIGRDIEKFSCILRHQTGWIHCLQNRSDLFYLVFLIELFHCLLRYGLCPCKLLLENIWR